MSDDIIDINTKEPVVAITTSNTSSEFPYCDCRKVWLDTHDRSVKCRKCGRMLDPFEWILRYAQTERSLLSRLTTLEEEYKRRHESVDKLKAEEQRVKSRIRAAKTSLLDNMGV